LIGFMYAMPFGIAGAIKRLWISRILSRVSQKQGGEAVSTTQAQSPSR
jgi:hypothetical protein